MKLRLSNIEDHLDAVLPLLADLCKRDSPSWSVYDAVERCRGGAWLLVTADEPGFAMVSVDQGWRLVIEVVCHPNSDLPLTAEMLSDIPAAIAAHNQSQHDKAVLLKQQVDGAVTIEQVLQVDWC